MENSRPAAGGTDLLDEDAVLLQAMRNLWPLLGAAGREQAIATAESL
jgi:hypothetical protein